MVKSGRGTENVPFDDASFAALRAAHLVELEHGRLNLEHTVVHALCNVMLPA